MSAQTLVTNAPELVYPILEEFIAENYNNDQRSLERLLKLDSLLIRNLPYTVTDYSIRKNYGFHHIQGNRHWIEIDSSLLQFPKEFNKTVKHELGHLFGLPHIITKTLPADDPLRLEIMSSEHTGRYLEIKYTDPDLWDRINKNFYESLISPQQ